MKTRFFSLTLPAVAGALALGALTLPDISLAKPDHKSGHSDRGRGKDKGRDRDYDRDQHYSRSRDDGGRRHYHSVPRTSFSLHFGTGYAGRGYYYGPANVPYYYERPEVRYYRTRELAPREYWGGGSSYRVAPVGLSVQSALSRRGYYRGPVDGQIGPYTRRSIARYQADHGLIPTGSINSSLLRSLGLQ